MIPFFVCLVAFVCSVVPAALVVLNLWCYRRIRGGSAPDNSETAPEISVLIPARNEAANLGPLLESVLANDDIHFEVIVVDDHSEDATARVVLEFARRDRRVRFASAPPLPAQWCGKQHACYILSTLAKAPILLFLDADVRLAPRALRRFVHFLSASGVDLASGVPRQHMETFSEHLLLPLIHFLLLGFLPMAWMRRTRAAAFGAGCGQLIVARTSSYRSSGGHSAICGSLHDGLQLPRLFRRAGFRTDLFDATDLVVCRMYHSNREVWQGLAKNAAEGLAAPRVIGPMTLILLTGQVLPFALLTRREFQSLTMTITLLSLIVTCVYFPRLLSAIRFQQPLRFVWLQPVAILSLLAIQWYAFGRALFRLPSVWKGRSYPSNAAPAASTPSTPRLVKT